MATTTTTLSTAATVGAHSIVVTSATGFQPDYLVRIGDEMMRVSKDYVAGATTIPLTHRGIMGTAQSAHPSGAAVTVGIATDWPGNPAQAFGMLPYQRITRQVEYSAAGAITLPNAGEDLQVFLNGTDVLAMTIADPGEEISGSSMLICADGAAAHTLTFASGLSGASTSYDVVTLNGSAIAALYVVAVKGYWVAPFAPAMGGTVTNLIGSVA